MRHKNTREQTSAIPPGKVKPPKLSPLSSQHSSDEPEEVSSNPEIQEKSPTKDEVIAPDGSPEPKQDQIPLY